MSDAGEPDAPGEQGAYVVLARKHRPQDFAALIGQDALVKVLTAAFALDRVPHAIMLTGVRGVGKTTTARIIAKGLNCLAVAAPTVAPCGVCDNCKMIAESVHPDVFEMDAASRTGIDDIREIIDGVAYRASRGRYKVYIIDEVHMLSKNAFNGLLKTLEEPPPHVKFVLATTDIHKVPVTVLSRCMRFDLRRVEADRMIAHLGAVCAAEGAEPEPEALALLARASEGSVRDALSLLDQAIAQAPLGPGGRRPIRADELRAMLGMADRGRVVELLERIMAGDAAGALSVFGAIHRDGAEPDAVLRDLGGLCHLAMMARVGPSRLEDPALAPADRAAAAALGARLSPRVLDRAWQMILRALDEVARAPSALAAAEMAVVRLTHVAELPPPEELVRLLREERGDGQGARGEGPGGRGGGAGGRGVGGDASGPVATRPEGPRSVASASGGGGPSAMRRAEPQAGADPNAAPEPNADPGPDSLEALAAMLEARREARLSFDVERYVRPGPIAPGRFEFTPVEGAPSDLAGRLGDRLTQWTGRRWVVSVADGHAGPTLAERKAAAATDLRARALAHPLVRAALEAFPGASLDKVRDLAAAPEPRTAEPADEALFEAGLFDERFEAPAATDDGWEPVDPAADLDFGDAPVVDPDDSEI